MEDKDPFSSYFDVMRKLPTDIYGLKFRPTLQPTQTESRDDTVTMNRLHGMVGNEQPFLDDDRDWPMKTLWGHPDNGWPGPPVEVSDANYAVCEEVIRSLGDCCKVIVEIGVNRNGERSMTHAYLKNKSDDCIYVGIDVEDKILLNNDEKRIHTIKTNSFNQAQIREFLTQLGIEKIDILAIDGWHSVNTAINDWKYADMLSDNGVVVLHDTNLHPGPICLFEAVDETLFDKVRHCTEYTDYGIATFRKK
jgi:hypothetical protein